MLSNRDQNWVTASAEPCEDESSQELPAQDVCDGSSSRDLSADDPLIVRAEAKLLERLDIRPPAQIQDLKQLWFEDAYVTRGYRSSSLLLAVPDTHSPMAAHDRGSQSIWTYYDSHELQLKVRHEFFMDLTYGSFLPPADLNLPPFSRHFKRLGGEINSR